MNRAVLALLALAACDPVASEPALRPLTECGGVPAACLVLFGDIAETRDPKRVVARTTGPHGHVLAVVVEVEGRLAGGEWRRHRLATRLDPNALFDRPGLRYAAAGPSALHTDRGVLELRPGSLRMGRDDGLVLIHADTGVVARHWAPDFIRELGFMYLTDPVWMGPRRSCLALGPRGMFVERDWQLCHRATWNMTGDEERRFVERAIGGEARGFVRRIPATPYFTIEALDRHYVEGRHAR
ncbi:MAG: hypothetical protein NBV67_13635 [Tagaea sp.]|nr:hypothetical protein [Tagaea sp.]